MCFRKKCVVQEGSFFFGTFYFRRWVYGEINLKITQKSSEILDEYGYTIYEYPKLLKNYDFS